MDIFKFTPTSDDTVLDQGAQVNGWDKVTWVERYSAPGEFTIEAPLSSGLSAFLPLGSLISHTDTMEVMIVENQEPEETFTGDPTIKITGRSFVSYLENRIVGMNLAKAYSAVAPYTLTSDYSWVQIVKMINDHIVSPPCDVNDAIVNVSAAHTITGTGIAPEARTIAYDNLWSRVSELLKIDDLGIQTIRRNPFGVPGGSSTQTIINIYKGEDKTSSVMFSWITGDIDEAKYLFSQKGLYNSALVLGQYVQVAVDGSETKYDRRTMLVDGSDIDGYLGAMPSGGDLVNIIGAMTVRGQQALAGQNETSITQIDLSSNTTYQYRKDYNLGDLVRIDGNFGQMDVRRVTEYAEIEDENGKSGHPTLSIVVGA